MTSLQNKIKSYNFILASSSPSRKNLISIMNLEPNMYISPNIDESVIKGESALEYSKRIAFSKAEKILKQYPKSLILAADTIAVCKGKILRKAKDEEYARYCLNILSGNRHRVYTSVCVAMDDVIKTKTMKTIIKFKKLEKSEIDYYIDSNEWLNKGGACSIQGIASTFVMGINGCYYNIIGLPISKTYNLLNSMI